MSTNCDLSQKIKDKIPSSLLQHLILITPKHLKIFPVVLNFKPPIVNILLSDALARCVDRGWLQQVSGRGFSGSYRLLYPYYPSPAQLWGEYYEPDRKKDKPAHTPSKGRKRVVEVESSEEELSEEEEEAEYIPVAKKRGAPKPR